MNTLSLENINNHAPYGVRHREDNFYSFYFETDFGLKYTISFMLENSFVQSGAFQFCINVEGAGRSPGDVRLRQTVFAIIEEFFAVNGKEAMLYLCETGDEKEGLRNRLFSDGLTPMNIVISTSFARRRVCLTASRTSPLCFHGRTIQDWRSCWQSLKKPSQSYSIETSDHGVGSIDRKMISGDPMIKWLLKATNDYRNQLLHNF